MKNRIRDNHKLPTVRLHKVVLENFKNVEYGKIKFSCGKANKVVPYGTRSDILGIYGQNGSGKTSFVEALAIVKYLLSGQSVPEEYAECIMEGKDSAFIEVTMDLQYEDGRIRKAIYSCCIENEEKQDEESDYEIESDAITQDYMYRLVVKNETLKLSGEFYGGSHKTLPIIVIDRDKSGFTPESRRKYFIKDEKETILQLDALKILAQKQSTSFIFSESVLDIFENESDYSEYYQVLLELNLYARHFLYVASTKSTGFIRLNAVVPIWTRTWGTIPLGTRGKGVVMPQEAFDDISKMIDCMSLVLSQIVPDMQLRLKSFGPTLTKKGKPAQVVDLVSVRNGVELPIRAESDGVRKVISILNLLIEAFNDQSITVAIDEFDAGIFEYVLGEILQSLQDYGKGQFIFTSHNLRPLEVLNKDFICFTTTNPQNRYIRMKHIGNTNNLRDVYYREILMDEQDETIYNSTQRYQMVAAIKEVGKRYEEAR